MKKYFFVFSVLSFISNIVLVQSMPPVPPMAQPMPTQPATFEQKKWPETVELSEEKKAVVSDAWKDEFEQYLTRSIKIRNDIQEVVSQIRNLRRDSQSKFQDIDKQLDLFLRDIGILEGKIQSQLLIADEGEELKSTDPLIVEQETKKRIEIETELSKFKNEVESLDKLEDELLNQLRKLDEQLDTAMDESIKARKLSIEMLDATDKNALELNLNQLSEILKKVEQIKNSLQTDFSKKFDDSLSQMKIQMQKLQENVKNLEQKGLKLEQESQDVIFEQKEKEEDKTRAEQTVVEKEILEKLIMKQEIKKESVLYRKTVDFIAASITFTKNSINWIVDVFKQAFKKSEKMESKTIDQTVATPEVTIPAVSEQVQTQLKTLDEDVKKIQEEKEQIQQARQDLEQLKEQKISQVKEQINLIEKFNLKEESKHFEWRKGLEYLFGKILDLATVIGQKLKFFVVKVYDTFFKDKLTNFVKAVQYRMEELKEEKRESVIEEKSVATEEKAAIPAEQQVVLPPVSPK